MGLQCGPALPEGGDGVILPVLILPLLIGLTGLAVEGGLWYADRHQLRAMADSAAIAATWARRDSEDEFSAAVAAADALGFDGGTDELVLNAPPLTGAFVADGNAVEVIVRRRRPPLLSSLFVDAESIDIGNRAVGRFEILSAPCVLALSESASSAIGYSGSAAVVLDGCGVASNSAAGTAVDVNDSALSGSGNASLTAEWARAVGRINVGNNADLITDTPPVDLAAPQLDPFADLPAPPRPPDCPSGTVASYTPCTFVGGISFGSGSVTDLEPGVYFVDGGEFRVNGGAVLTGSGVTVYLTGGASARVNGGAELHISAPTLGTYAGMAFVQDRNDAGGTSRFNGGATMDIQGSLYFPNQEIEFSGGSALAGGCTRVVSDTLNFTGNSATYLGNDCAGFGLSEVVEDLPHLVE